MAMTCDLTTEEDIREALKFNCEETYQRLRNFKINTVSQYWVYDEKFTPAIQISVPKLINKAIGQGTSAYQPKPVSN